MQRLTRRVSADESQAPNLCIISHVSYFVMLYYVYYLYL